MTHKLEPGDLAVVIPDEGGPNNVRMSPRIGARIKGKVPEHAVLALLPKPANWHQAYPYDDGQFLWFYVRGRTAAKHGDARFKLVEGWTAAAKQERAFLRRMEMGHACHNTMGTALETHLQQGQQAYVLPSDGLNVRRDSDPSSEELFRLRPGAVVTLLSAPACRGHMVWWRVESGAAGHGRGWAGEGDQLEQYLIPLTLM